MILSVIICTHNPRPDFLQRVLDALKAQTLPKEQWELLLIDNTSKEPLAGSWDLSWHPNARHIREEELGLTPTRLRGIREANSDLLIFLDDDNIPQRNYLEVAGRIADEHPNLGCYGAGVLKPEFEMAPAPEYLPYTSYLALRSIPRSTWGNLLPEIPMPWGAGLVVRRTVAEYYENRAKLCPIRSGLDRKGQSLMSGGDDEFSYAAVDLNLGVGVFTELEITHLIDKRRVTGEYLQKMLLGNGRSSAILAYLHGKSLDNPFNYPRLGVAFKYLLQGHLARSLTVLANWIGLQRRPQTESFFRLAQFQGWELGIQDIAAYQQAAERAGKMPEKTAE
jgi:glycosyltransferase involved in cell wall biosynthesis